MLVLSRRVGEKIVIDGNITVTVLEFSGSRVRLGFDAPQDVRIRRNEIVFDANPIGSPPPAQILKPSEVCNGHYFLDA